jgi:RimJ/RimL family protein N-acetyltransferase
MRIFLETERLVLRRFTEADVDDLVELDGDPRGHAPARRRKAHAARGGREARPAAVSGLLRALHRVRLREFLGWFHLRPQGDKPCLRGRARAGLRRQARGGGYPAEGSRAVLRRALTELGVRGVVASTMAVDIGSRRVMGKAGLAFVRTFHPSSPEPIAASEQGCPAQGRPGAAGGGGG